MFHTCIGIHSPILLLLIFLNNAISDEDRRILTSLKYSKNYIFPTIVNGVPVKEGQVPYLVSIKEALTKLSKIKSIWTNICGGSILSSKKVLTAAHCFEYKHYLYLKQPKKLRLVAGDFMTQVIHTGNTDTTETCQWRKISKIVIHGKYYFPDNDIALIFVNEPWRFTNKVGYILPARRRVDYQSSCISAGFGSISHKSKNTATPILLIGQMFVMPRHNCSRLWEMNMDKFICTYSFLSDVSHGDSGGPLSCKGTLDPTEKRSTGELLVGVVSGKNFDKTTLFTRVSEYRDWIDKNVAERIKFSFLILINFGFFALYVSVLSSYLFHL